MGGVRRALRPNGKRAARAWVRNEEVLEAPSSVSSHLDIFRITEVYTERSQVASTRRLPKMNHFAALLIGPETSPMPRHELQPLQWSDSLERPGVAALHPTRTGTPIVDEYGATSSHC